MISINISEKIKPHEYHQHQPIQPVKPGSVRSVAQPNSTVPSATNNPPPISPPKHPKKKKTHDIIVHSCNAETSQILTLPDVTRCRGSGGVTRGEMAAAEGRRCWGTRRRRRAGCTGGRRRRRGRTAGRRGGRPR